MNEQRVSVRLQAIGGDKMKAEFAEIGRTGARAFNDISKSSRSSSFQLQNAAFQVGDFFVQVNSGTSATRALAQQLPQLLGGFGLFGALAGAAFAALVPLVGKMFEGEDAAKGLAEDIDDLVKATKSHEDAAKAAQVTIVELRQRYGELADEIKRARENTEALTRAEAESALDTSIQGVTGTILGDTGLLRSNAALDAIGGGLDALIAKADTLQDELSLGGGTAAMFQELTDTEQAVIALQNVKVEVEDLADRYRITADEAVRLAEAANDLRDAGSIAEQAEAANALAEELISVFGSTKAVEDALPGILSALSKITEQAGDLATNMESSADEAARLARNFATAQQQIAADGKVYSGRGGDPRTSNQQGVGEFHYDGPTLDINNNPIKKKSSGGGAKVDPRQREAERWFDRTRTAAERYAEELKDLKELQALGYLDADTYARAVKEIGEAYDTASEQGKFFADLQRDLKEGFLDAIVDGKSLGDVFDDLAKSIARAALEAALFNTGPFGVQGGGGGLLGTIFGGLFGGFRESGGPVIGGKAYVVGEDGPELFTPGVSGSIVPNDRLAAGAAGGVQVDVRVYVDETGTLKAAVEKISGKVAGGMIAQNNRRLREAQRR